MSGRYHISIDSSSLQHLFSFIVCPCPTCRVLAFCLPGCHDQSDLLRLRELARTSVRLERGEGESGKESLLCRTVRRGAAGKTEVASERLKLGAGGALIADKISAEEEPQSVAPAGSQQDEELSRLTTFSLGLTEREKEERERLVLPFYKEDQKKKEEEDEEEEGSVRIQSRNKDESPSSGGKIYYDPEDVDDWDDEDPDDDLDF